MNHLSGFAIFLTVLFLVISILMIMIILVQRGRGGGLAGAFGAGGGAATAFGTKTGDVFTTVTVIFFTCFMILAIYLNHLYKPETPTEAPAAPVATMPDIPTEFLMPPTNPATEPSTTSAAATTDAASATATPAPASPSTSTPGTTPAK